MDLTDTAARLSRARDALSTNQFSDAKSLADDDLLAHDQLLALKILAIADVHIAAAAQSPSAADQDYYYYSILGIDKGIISDDDSIFFRYRLLAHLLDPQLNNNDGDHLLPNATEALTLVTQAYRALSAPPVVAAAAAAEATTSKRKRPKPQARKTVRAIRFCPRKEDNGEGHTDEEEDEEDQRLLRERRIAEEGEDVDDD